jgi:hypothetical protein
MKLNMKLELILKIKSNKSQNRFISFYKFVVIWQYYFAFLYILLLELLEKIF